MAPVLFLDTSRALAALEQFRRCFPGVHVHYPVKCNPQPQLLRALHAEECGFEVASAVEATSVQSVGAAVDRVLFGNPVRARSETQTSYDLGIRRYAIDSPGELDRVAAIAPEAQVYARIATRPGHSVVPSEGKFGTSVDAAVGLLDRAGSQGLTPYGISFHVGSQSTRPEAWKAPIQAVIGALADLERRGIRVSMLDIGGGFPVRYESPVPSLEEYGGYITDLLAMLPYPLEIIAEPGRFLVAEAGVLRCSVLDVVRRGGTWWIHTDLGVFNGMMEVLESGGTLTYPISDQIFGGTTRRYNVTGPTCDSQDTFGFDVELSEVLTEGDHLLVNCAGAYTTVYASDFNGFSAPSIVVLSNTGPAAAATRATEEKEGNT